MKTVLIVEHDNLDPAAPLTLLREHGYRVSELAGEIAPQQETKTGDLRRETIAPAVQQSAGDNIHFSGEAMLVARVSDGRVLELNAPFSELTGYGKEDLIGQNMQCIAFFLNPEEWSRAMEDLKEGKPAVALETRILRKDGLVAFVTVNLGNAEVDGIPCHVMTLHDKPGIGVIGGVKSRPRFSGPEPGDLLLPDMDISRENIARLIDFAALQDLMNSFYKTTRIGIGIIDMRGNVHVATGWQDVCTRFYRIHPETQKNCLESDIYFSQNIREGEITRYKCRNNLWDIATPIIVGDRHIANIFLGQFFFEDEVPDYEFFRKQADIYGFDAEQFLAAIDRVPRWSRETVENVMEFYSKLAQLISRLSIGNIMLSQALAQQEAISEELHQASLVVENSPVVLFRWRAAEGWPVELVSRNVIQFGYTPEELLSASIPFASMVHPEDLERVTTEVREYSAKGVDNFQQEYRLLAKGGEIHWVYDRTVVERDAGGRPTHFQGIVIDITERKLVEEALRGTTHRLQSIFRVAPIGIGVVRNRAFLEVNRRFCEMTGYSQEEVIGKSAAMLYSVPDEYERVGLDKYSQIAEKGTGSVESIWQRKDGTVIDVFLASTPLDPSDLGKGVIFTVLDITERKKSVEKIHAALAEKVILLKEVHHRVKNNLQIISTLLDLQSENIHDEDALKAFRESQNRIKAMALVHEKLYESDDIASIDFARYIKELSLHLFDTYLVDPGRIELKVKCEDIPIGIDQAIPCGLIINELVTNALKYAFPGNRQGEIHLELQAGDDGIITLGVADNGIGLPPGMDLTKTGTLGLQLVTMLTRQLKGEISISNEKGAEFSIRFKG